MANFVSYSDAQALMTKIGQKFSSLTGAYIPKGSLAFASLPATPTPSMSGYVYNMTDDFTTDARFVEGAGKDYPQGSNVVVVDNSTYSEVTPIGSEDPSSEGWYELVDSKYVLSTDTEVDGSKTYYAKTTLIQYDVLAGFIDISGLEDEIATIVSNFADEFDDTENYAINDVVIYENKLYKFTSAHTAGAWDDTEVTAITVEELIGTIPSSDKRVTDFDTAKESGIYYFEDLPSHGPSLPALYTVKGGLLIADSGEGLTEQTTFFVEGDGSGNLSFKAYIRTEVILNEWSNWRLVSTDPQSLTSAQISDLEGLLD